MHNKLAVGVLVFCSLFIGCGLVSTDRVDHSPAEKNVKVEQLKITGLGEVFSPGEIIALRVDDPNKTDKVTYNWIVLDSNSNIKQNTIIFPAGDTLFFGSGIQPQNKFTIILVANYLVKSELITKVYTGNVFVGTKPDPNPTPVPVPVDPTFPDGKYKLANFTFKLVKETVNASNKTAVAKALSESYSSIASAISAGAYSDVETILKKTQESNLAALNKSGANLKDWEPVRLKIVDYIYDFYQKGSLRTAEDFAIAWREIAEGLGGVK